MPAVYRDMPCGTRRGTGWLERAAETRRGREHAGRARVDETVWDGRGRGPLEGDYGFLYALICVSTCTRESIGTVCGRERARTRARRVEGYLL